MTNVGFAPGTTVSWRRPPAATGPGVLQIGTGPTGVLLHGVTHREALSLQRLRTPHPRDRFLAHAAADRVDPHRARELLDALTAAGLVSTRGGGRTVAVVGLEPMGLLVAQGLADAGVRDLHLVDDDPVRPTDVGRAWFRPESAGRPRAAAVAELLADRHPDVRLSTDAHPGQPAVAVVCGLALVASRQAAQYLSTDVPHLPLVVSGDGVCVGPVVRPGWDACVRCMQLHRSDADPQWAVRCLQSGRTAPGPAMVALAAAGAVGQVMAHLDGVPGDRRSVRFRLPDGAPDLIEWQPHPRCGCRDHPSVRALA